MIYHICNKSISDFIIFNNDYEFSRILLAIRYYQFEKQIVSLARFIRPYGSKEYRFTDKIEIPEGKERLVNIITYCIMPTHIHLIVEEMKKGGVPIFINNILNSYTRYFNTKHNRKGPLWEGRSKKILINSDEQLLHDTRYIHLNPVTAHIVDKPENWKWSSYKEYLLDIGQSSRICKYRHLLNIDVKTYKQFVEDGIARQRELARIKKLPLE